MMERTIQHYRQERCDLQATQTLYFDQKLNNAVSSKSLKCLSEIVLFPLISELTRMRRI